jgi:hypothetical protein
LKKLKGVVFISVGIVGDNLINHIYQGFHAPTSAFFLWEIPTVLWEMFLVGMIMFDRLPQILWEIPTF